MKSEPHAIFSPAAFVRQRFGGVSKYFCELFVEFEKLSLNFSVYGPRRGNVHLDNLPASLASALRLTYTDLSEGRLRMLRAFLCDVSFARGLEGQKNQVLHETYYPAFSQRQAIPVVTTVHDMCDEKVGRGLGALRRSVLKKRALNRADAIIAVSKSTKKDLIEVWNIPASRIVTISHGIRPQELWTGARFSELPYLLYVGQRGGYKNFPNLVKAYADSRCAKEGIELVCFGGASFSANERNLIADLKLTNQVRHSAGNDALLRRAYRGAQALVYPSLFEGFGLPLLEAMAQDCPVVASNHPALMEVGGDAAHYFEAIEPEAIAAAFDLIALSDDHREELIKAGRERIRFFSWKESAHRHLEIYRSLVP